MARRNGRNRSDPNRNRYPDDSRNDHQYNTRSNGSRDGPDDRPRSPPRNSRDFRNVAPPSSLLPPRRPSGGYDNHYRPQNHMNDRGPPGYENSYRPNSNSYGGFQRPPPPRSPPPPPPPGLPHYSQPPQGDFTFRMEKPAGVGESVDSYRPGDRGNRNADAGRGRRPLARDRKNDRGRGNHRGPWRPFVAAERELLNARHSSNNERVMFNSDHEVRYRAVEDLSDSDETGMDISGEEDDSDAEPSHKRVRLTEPKPAPETSAQPKWSNPDPYTALPPPDTVTNQKKKDVVQLIRKARVDAKETKSSAETEAAADYISFDFDDSDDEDKRGGEEVKPPAKIAPQPPPGAPTGPRNSSLFNGKELPAGLPPRPASPPGSNARASEAINGQNKPSKPLAQQVLASDTNSALGNRKRTHDDKIKLPDHARLKKAVKMPAHGDLVAEWKAIKGEEPCPWNTVDHSETPSMGLWLHKEIVDFYDYIKPREFEDRIRGEVVAHLQTFCRKIYGDKLSVLPFGSFPSGLYLPTGDMDLVLVSDRYANGGAGVYSTKSALYRLQAALRNNSMAHLNEIEVIARAKVPLVKYIEKRSGLKMDISFENLTGVQAIETFKAWKEQYPSMPIVVTLVKQFLAMRGLNEPVNGGIGGFSVICMVVSMLQLMPQVQSRTMIPAHHYGDLLMEFFDLYGNRFNFNEVAISLNPPKYIPKNKITAFAYRQTDRFSIIDPNNAENDIAGGSSNTGRIVKAFSEAHRQLREQMAAIANMPDRNGASILQVILAGNYSSFRLQREHIEVLSNRGLDYEAREQGPRQPQW